MNAPKDPKETACWDHVESSDVDEPPLLSLTELREKYSKENSRFVDIDGVDLHYCDEGQGIPVVLLHASFLNLQTWDLLTEHLTDKYRVIRFDFPNAGLSGPETTRRATQYDGSIRGHFESIVTKTGTG